MINSPISKFSSELHIGSRLREYQPPRSLFIERSDNPLYSYKKKVHLSGLLWLHRISDRRMGETALKNIAMFEQLCGKSALANVVLVTTMWADVEEEIGRTREGQLKRLYWKAMISAGSQMMRFDNTPESAWAIIAQLKPRRLVTQLQVGFASSSWN